MPTIVSNKMLELKPVTDVTIQGDNLVVSFGDGTTTSLPIGNMPAIAQVASMATKVAQIQAYIAAHP